MFHFRTLDFHKLNCCWKSITSFFRLELLLAERPQIMIFVQGNLFTKHNWMQCIGLWLIELVSPNSVQHNLMVGLHSVAFNLFNWVALVWKSDSPKIQWTLNFVGLPKSIKCNPLVEFHWVWLLTVWLTVQDTYILHIAVQLRSLYRTVKHPVLY